MRFVLALILSGILILPATASAITVAIVDMKKIVEDSSAAQGVLDEMEKARDTFQDDFAKEEEELHKENEELANQRELLPKDVFEQKAKEFRNKVVEAQRGFQERRAALESAHIKAMNTIKETLLDIIEDVAEEKKLSLVLQKSQVLFSEDALDISEDVLDKLNDKLPEVKVKVELPD